MGTGRGWRRLAVLGTILFSTAAGCGDRESEAISQEIAPGDLGTAGSRPRRGSQTARLLIHEITDLECSYCAKVQPTLERILQTYPEDVALIWVDSPLPQHDGAVVAAEAAREVRAQRGDPAFWTFTSRLFANQRVFAAADLAEDARALGGIDLDRFRQALSEGWHRAEVAEETDKVARLFGNELGTPTFLVGRYVILGAQPFAVFQRAIEEELKE